MEWSMHSLGLVGEIKDGLGTVLPLCIVRLKLRRPTLNYIDSKSFQKYRKSSSKIIQVNRNKIYIDDYEPDMESVANQQSKMCLLKQ